MPIIKTAQNTNTTQKQHRYTKQTNKRKQHYRKRHKSTGAKPLYSEETQTSLFKNVPVQRKICFKEVIIIIIIIIIIICS
jgi:hypothetical protein